MIYEALIEDKKHDQRSANLEYLRILKLAADNIEEDVDIALSLLLSSKEMPLTVETISSLILNKSAFEIDDMKITPDLNIYDHLFLNGHIGEEKNEKLYH